LRKGGILSAVCEHGQAAGPGLVDVAAYWTGWDGGPGAPGKGKWEGGLVGWEKG
jgi:hypothetical protein